MLDKLLYNLKFLRRYLIQITPKPLRSESINFEKNKTPDHSTSCLVKTMNPLKNLVFFILKVIIFLVLANTLLIKPLTNSISKGLDGFDNNPLIKIISLDLITNPLTFIRMTQYYIDKKDPQKALLYLKYAETIKARYPYPKEINEQISDLQAQIRKLHE